MKEKVIIISVSKDSKKSFEGFMSDAFYVGYMTALTPTMYSMNEEQRIAHLHEELGFDDDDIALHPEADVYGYAKYFKEEFEESGIEAEVIVINGYK